MAEETEELLTLRADNTHLFPGAFLLVDNDAELPEDLADIIVLFSDEVDAPAELEPMDEDFILTVAPYTTASGTDIDEKAWRVVLDQPGVLKVTEKLAAY